MGESVRTSLEKAKGLNKTASEIAKHNPDGARRLRDKAIRLENKAISRLGRKPKKGGSPGGTKGISIG